MKRTLSIVESANELSFEVTSSDGALPSFWQLASSIGRIELKWLPQLALILPTPGSGKTTAMICRVAKVAIPYHSHMPDSLESFTNFLAQGISDKHSYLLPRWYGCKQAYCTAWYYADALAATSVAIKNSDGCEADFGIHQSMHQVYDMQFACDPRSWMKMFAQHANKEYSNQFLWFIKSNYRPFDATIEATKVFATGMAQPLPLTSWVVSEAGLTCRFETFFSNN
jgi:hypothetical protein